jgi:hypothetical protein
LGRFPRALHERTRLSLRKALGLQGPHVDLERLSGR